MKMSRENYYILLELQLDPPEIYKDRIERAIEEKRVQWSKTCMDPSPARARNAEMYLEMLPDIKRVMSDADERRKKAEDAITKEKEEFEKIDEAIKLVSPNGSITEKAVSKLFRMLLIDEKVIRERIKVPIVKTKLVEKLETSLYRKITENLKAIEKKSLYDFPGARADSGLNDLRASAEKIAADLKTDSNKDLKHKDKQKLISYCFDLFETEEMRFRYDASLAYQSWYELNKYININGIISVDAFDFLMETAGNHKESLPGDGGNSKLDTLAERFGILESEFESKIKYDRHKEKIIDNLHKERQDYKNDLVKSLLRPMIMDIIHSIGGNTTLVNNLKEDVPQLDPQELVKQMEGILYELEEVLFRQGV